MDISEQSQANELVEISEAMGVIRQINVSEYGPIKIALYPFQTTQYFYYQLGYLSTLWQRIIHQASKNHQFIQKVFTQLRKNDIMIDRMYGIYKECMIKNKEQLTITFTRCDYYIQESPKLTEYNLFSVGMLSHAQQFQSAQRLVDYENQHRYVEHQAIDDFATAIAFAYNRRSLKGLFVFVVTEVDSNFLDQKRFQICLKENKIKCKRITMKQMNDFMHVDKDNNLHFKESLVSVLYYRTGYKMEHYTQTGDQQKAWAIKKMINLSNTIVIPTITMQLMNCKRMQAELSKPQVYNQWFSPQEYNFFNQSIVKQWEFDTLTNQNQLIQDLQKNNPDGYILKFNREGGGNNIFGVDALHKLKKMSQSQRKNCILMQKIYPTAVKNVLLRGKERTQMSGHYQVSRAGIMICEDGKLKQNTSNGFLIRIKPENQNEGGIMVGVGAIVNWKTIE